MFGAHESLVEKRFRGFFGVWMLVRIVGKFVSICDESPSSDIEGCPLHFVEQVGTEHFAGASYNLVLALVHNLGFVDCDARLLFNSMFQLVQRFII